MQGNKHKQISGRLRDAQSKRWILKAEVELVNQKRDARIAEIGALQLQFEVQSHGWQCTSVIAFILTDRVHTACVSQDWQRKLSQLLPEKQQLTEKLRNITLSRHSRG